MGTVIKVEQLGKQYRLGEVGTGTLSHDLNRWMAKIRGKEDPFSKVGEANDRTRKGGSDYVWALRDINFEVQAGEVLGIIGRNGAGKSTLLKILSKVTKPTVGLIKTRGRIASLLEVGTGFHPEMTGRENTFLNGAIMGMTKAEIKSKFDEIVDFAGVERYIDTPVKRYSSGMYVRLAFAVAAHLEPEILVVDEVLAVGDAEFQKKCLGKMKDVSVNDGRTVLFVSHNMAAVSSLCNTGLILKNGGVHAFDEIQDIISIYSKIGDGAGGQTIDESAPTPGKKVKIQSVRVINEFGNVSASIDNAHSAFIELSFEVLIEGRGYDVAIELIHTSYGTIFGSTFKDVDPAANDSNIFKKGIYTYKIALPMELLRAGDYIINAASAIPKFEMLDEYKYETYFSLTDSISPVAKTTEGRRGAILPVIKWERV
jgi:lipopolysaccharide transport system ATP-binding protein